MDGSTFFAGAAATALRVHILTPVCKLAALLAHPTLGTLALGTLMLTVSSSLLQMPFTVFTTSHKKTFLKWHAKLTGGVAPTNGGGTGTGAAAAVQTYQVYDMTDDTISCMTDDGDTVEVDAAGCEAALVARVRELFDGGADVRVTLHDKRSLASIMNT